MNLSCFFLLTLILDLDSPFHFQYSLCKKSVRKLMMSPECCCYTTLVLHIAQDQGRCIWVPPGAQSKHLSVSPLHRLSEYVNDRSIFSCVKTLVISHICLDFRPWFTTVTDRHYHHQSEKLFSSANSASIKRAWIINNWIILYCAIHSSFSLLEVAECVGMWNLIKLAASMEEAESSYTIRTCPRAKARLPSCSRAAVSQKRIT